MRICGVIAEYNPFHNGHRYHLNEARRLSGCDYLIVCMGGAFSQRGEVMLLDKWTRARMALQSGADLVVELPALFAVRSADAFATGALLTLAGMGASSLSFGCETDDLSFLGRLAEMLDAEDAALRDAIRRRLIQGKSHVRARGEAISERLSISEEVLSRPNTILALEYLRANRRLAQPLDIHIVRRTQGYHDPDLHEWSSASAVRAAVYAGNIRSACIALPETAGRLLTASFPGRIADASRLDALLIDRLRSMPPEEIASLPDISEGLERRVAKYAETAGSRSTLLSSLKCKRYPYARLSRLCAHALLGMTERFVRRHTAPEYARVLGFRADAEPLLSYVSKQPLPLITRPALLKENESFRLERRATDLQALCFPDESARCGGRDLTERMIVI